MYFLSISELLVIYIIKNDACMCAYFLLVASPPPFTPESVFRVLLPVASKWLLLGEAFPLSEKRLEDITTTESDEICLKEMVDVYMLRTDLDHTWDEIANVLKKIGEYKLAAKIQQEQISTCMC